MTWYYPLQGWFHIEYEDCDEEDIELDELNRAIILAKKHARMTPQRRRRLSAVCSPVVLVYPVVPWDQRSPSLSETAGVGGLV